MGSIVVSLTCTAYLWASVIAFSDPRLVKLKRMREGLKWKAHSHEVRVARTWNVKPDPPAGGARQKICIFINAGTADIKSKCNF